MRAFLSSCGPLFFVWIVGRERRHVSLLQEFEAEGVSTCSNCSQQSFAFLSHRRRCRFC